MTFATRSNDGGGVDRQEYAADTRSAIQRAQDQIRWSTESLKRLPAESRDPRIIGARFDHDQQVKRCRAFLALSAADRRRHGSPEMYYYSKEYPRSV